MFFQASNDTSSSLVRPLESLTHEEIKDLLVSLGCESFSEDSVFLQIKIKGSDLMEIENIEDLNDCGIQSCSRMRLKSILKSIQGFKEKGVQTSMIHFGKTDNENNHNPIKKGNLEPSNEALHCYSIQQEMTIGTAVTDTTAKGATELESEKLFTTQSNHDQDQALISISVPEASNNDSGDNNSPLLSRPESGNNLESTSTVVPLEENIKASNNGDNDNAWQTIPLSSIKSQSAAWKVNYEGISCLTIFKPMMQTWSMHPTSLLVDVSNFKDDATDMGMNCLFLNEPAFASLSTFRSGEGTPVSQISLSDLYGSNRKANMILSGQYHHPLHGYVFPPTEFYRQLYGCIIPRYPPKTKTGTAAAIHPSATPLFSFFTPYQRLFKDNPTASIPLRCGIVMIPNYDTRYFPSHSGWDSHVLRFTHPTSQGRHYLTNGNIAAKYGHARVRILVKDASTSLTNLTRPSATNAHTLHQTRDDTSGISLSDVHANYKIRQYGIVESTYPLNPETVNPNDPHMDEAIPDGPSNYHERLYLLFNIHTMSLVAIREGLLVLISDLDGTKMMNGKPQQNRNRYHLGVVYFTRDLSVKVIAKELEVAWKQCKERLEESQWKGYTNMLRQVQSAKKLQFLCVPGQPRPLSGFDDESSNRGSLSQVTEQQSDDAIECNEEDDMEN